MSAGREDVDKTVYTGYSLTSVSRDPPACRDYAAIDIICHKCGQPPLIVPKREGWYCGRCSTGMWVTRQVPFESDARVEPGDHPEIDARVQAVAHLPFDEAMRALYPMPLRDVPASWTIRRSTTWTCASCRSAS